MIDIKRYECETVPCPINGYRGEMQEHSTGGYVLYSDYLSSRCDVGLRQSVRDAINLLEQHPAAPIAPMAEAIRILSLGLCNDICPPCDTGENTDCICQPIGGAR